MTAVESNNSYESAFHELLRAAPEELSWRDSLFTYCGELSKSRWWPMGESFNNMTRNPFLE
jgi:hypothetical protein